MFAFRFIPVCMGIIGRITSAVCAVVIQGSVVGGVRDCCCAEYLHE